MGGGGGGLKRVQLISPHKFCNFNCPHYSPSELFILQLNSRFRPPELYFQEKTHLLGGVIVNGTSIGTASALCDVHLPEKNETIQFEEICPRSNSPLEWLKEGDQKCAISTDELNEI